MLDIWSTKRYQFLQVLRFPVLGQFSFQNFFKIGNWKWGLIHQTQPNLPHIWLPRLHLHQPASSLSSSSYSLTFNQGDGDDSSWALKSLKGILFRKFNHFIVVVFFQKRFPLISRWSLGMPGWTVDKSSLESRTIQELKENASFCWNAARKMEPTVLAFKQTKEYFCRFSSEGRKYLEQVGSSLTFVPPFANKILSSKSKNLSTFAKAFSSEQIDHRPDFDRLKLVSYSWNVSKHSWWGATDKWYMILFLFVCNANVFVK